LIVVIVPTIIDSLEVNIRLMTFQSIDYNWILDMTCRRFDFFLETAKFESNYFKGETLDLA
jgi:hypothetical protein